MCTCIKAALVTMLTSAVFTVLKAAFRTIAYLGDMGDILLQKRDSSPAEKHNGTASSLLI